MKIKAPILLLILALFTSRVLTRPADQVVYLNKDSTYSLPLNLLFANNTFSNDPISYVSSNPNVKISSIASMTAPQNIIPFGKTGNLNSCSAAHSMDGSMVSLGCNNFVGNWEYNSTSNMLTPTSGYTLDMGEALEVFYSPESKILTSVGFNSASADKDILFSFNSNKTVPVSQK